MKIDKNSIEKKHQFRKQFETSGFAESLSY